MLKEIQKKKLTHYFNILDYNNNGVIQEEDFVAIAENLCVLWGLKEDTEDHQKWISRFKNQWAEFRDYTIGAGGTDATIEDWLKFADEKLVNGDELYYSLFIEKMAEDIFDLFDEDKNGYIELNEFIDFFMAFRIEIRYSAKSFTMLDSNKDDSISKDELITGINAFFRSDDENNPGNWLFGFWEGGKQS
ncbi:MAG: EF-hand domain-containing protein [Bacteroidota bacterium]